MSETEISKAFESGSTLVWNDPDPIEGNDYTIRSISYIDEEMAVIQYGEKGNFIDGIEVFSEAEVFISEISLVD